jgi:hypothetical protein
MLPITVGRIIQCWPERHNPAPEGHEHYLEGPDGEPVLRCAAIVAGVFADKIAVHYYLPDGANGACEFPISPGAELKRGNWWWPPRA